MGRPSRHERPNPGRKRQLSNRAHPGTRSPDQPGRHQALGSPPAGPGSQIRGSTTDQLKRSKRLYNRLGRAFRAENNRRFQGDKVPPANDLQIERFRYHITNRVVGQWRVVRTVCLRRALSSRGRPRRPKFLTRPPRHAATHLHPSRKGPLEHKPASQLPPKRKPAWNSSQGLPAVTKPVTEKNSFPQSTTEELSRDQLRSITCKKSEKGRGRIRTGE
jgi:hypothetical protein